MFVVGTFLYSFIDDVVVIAEVMATALGFIYKQELLLSISSWDELMMLIEMP